ncbi:MAG: hypothetical protein ACHBNF_02295 [Chromatiales bacterium]
MTSSKDSAPTSGSRPGWQLRTETGLTVARLSKRDVLDGLRQGWISLDDVIRQGEEQWKPIRDSLGRTEFEFQVHLDTGTAYAKQFGKVTARVAVWTWVALFVSPALLHAVRLYSNHSIIVGYAEEINREIPILIVLIVAGLAPLVWMLLLAFLRVFILVGCANLLVFIGLSFLFAPAWVGPSSWLLLVLFIHKLMSYAFLAAFAFGMWKGFWIEVGADLGRRVGIARARQYALPVIRAPIPEHLKHQATVEPEPP